MRKVKGKNWLRRATGGSKNSKQVDVELNRKKFYVLHPEGSMAICDWGGSDGEAFERGEQWRTWMFWQDCDVDSFKQWITNRYQRKRKTKINWIIDFRLHCLLTRYLMRWKTSSRVMTKRKFESSRSMILMCLPFSPSLRGSKRKGLDCGPSG